MDIIPVKQGEKYDSSVIALGNFDGVHLGHQKLLEHGKIKAKQLNSKLAVLLLNPHPYKVLHPERRLNLLTDQAERLALFARYGVQTAFLYPFTLEFANTSPREFVEDILLSLGAVHIVVGFNYSFGCRGKGTPEDLQAFGKEYGFDVSIIEAERLNDKVISSSEIRSCLENGDIVTAKAMMGRPPVLKGTVIHGDKRGRELGFPTANLKIESDLLIPKKGVYAVSSEIDGRTYGGMMNIGLRPTFTSDQEQTCEIFFFDFNDDLYGKELLISIQSRLRSEKKFKGVDEIIIQLDKDRHEAIKSLAAIDSEIMKDV